jgi:hypothetical protein
VTRDLAEELPKLAVAEDRVYAEDADVLSGIEPRRLGHPLDDQVHTLADAYTLAFRRAFLDYIKTYGAPIESPAVAVAPSRVEGLTGPMARLDISAHAQ